MSETPKLTAEQADVLRAAMVAHLPSGIQHAKTPLLHQHLYVPNSHLRALSPDNMLVRGIRGAGKTVWWQALRDPEVRALLQVIEPRAIGIPIARVVPGFGADPDPDHDHYPDRDGFARMLGRFEPRLIWRTIFLWAVADASDLPAFPAWEERVAWVAGGQPGLLRQLDLRARERGEVRLVVFDALDRTAGDRPTMVRVLRGLLELLVEVRELRSLRAKAFVRPDMLDDPASTAFPDASKVLGSAVDLSWRPAELYAMLWQYLANLPDPAGELFRGLGRELHFAWKDDGPAGWRSPRIPEERYRALMHIIAHPWMGTNHRRGDVYEWLPTHLQDGRGQISPRSFVVAIRRAAEETLSGEYALGWEAVRGGVQAASELRIHEIKEDHPWVERAAEPLGGVDALRVPFTAPEVLARWERDGTIERILRTKDVSIPAQIEEGGRGLLRELVRLGVFRDMADGRLNMPDVYRVGFGLKRKGGVPPLSMN